MSTFVALLRGINVGGKNNVSMSSLKRSFEKLGLQDVRTYINSGNVLFHAAGPDPAALEQRIDGMLAREYGLNAKTVVRSAADMLRVAKTIERTWTADPDWKCNVIFLRRHLDAKRLLAGTTLKTDIERAVACPGTLVWSARIDALSRTAMMKFGRSQAYQDATVRSVTTTRTIAEMMGRMKTERPGGTKSAATE